MAAQRLIDIDDARRTILDAVTPLAAEHVKLDECLGRVLAEGIVAAAPVPARGSRLGAAELGVVGSLGRGEARCALFPRVSVLVTGDELLGAGEPARPGAVHDTNSHSIPALARLAGARVTAVARCLDEP